MSVQLGLEIAQEKKVGWCQIWRTWWPPYTSQVNYMPESLFLPPAIPVINVLFGLLRHILERWNHTFPIPKRQFVSLTGFGHRTPRSMEHFTNSSLFTVTLISHDYLKKVRIITLKLMTALTILWGYREVNDGGNPPFWINIFTTKPWFTWPRLRMKMARIQATVFKDTHDAAPNLYLDRASCTMPVE